MTLFGKIKFQVVVAIETELTCMLEYKMSEFRFCAEALQLQESLLPRKCRHLQVGMLRLFIGKSKLSTLCTLLAIPQVSDL